MWRRDSPLSAPPVPAGPSDAASAFDALGVSRSIHTFAQGLFLKKISEHADGEPPEGGPVVDPGGSLNFVFLTAKTSPMRAPPRFRFPRPSACAEGFLKIGRRVAFGAHLAELLLEDDEQVVLHHTDLAITVWAMAMSAITVWAMTM